MAIRTYVGTLVISTTVAYILAYINIKRLQIDQHRAWMIRAWAYVSGTWVADQLAKPASIRASNFDSPQFSRMARK